MMGYWTSFARSGDPNGVGRPDWPMAAGKGNPTLLLIRNDGPVAVPTPDAGRLDLIEQFRERPRGRPRALRPDEDAARPYQH